MVTATTASWCSAQRAPTCGNGAASPAPSNNPVTDFPALFGCGRRRTSTLRHHRQGRPGVRVRPAERPHPAFSPRLGELKRVIPGRARYRVRRLGIGGAPGLGTAGSAWDLDVHQRPRSKTYMFEVDGGNEQSAHHGPRARQDLILHSLGQPGHQAGQFTYLHSVVLGLEGQPIHRRDDQRPPRTEVHAARVQPGWQGATATARTDCDD